MLHPNEHVLLPRRVAATSGLDDNDSAIAGIVLGVCAFVALLICIFLYLRRRKVQKQRRAENERRMRMYSGWAKKRSPNEQKQEREGKSSGGGAGPGARDEVLAEEGRLMRHQQKDDGEQRKDKAMRGLGSILQALGRI